jgi:hypothetical protein
MIMHVIWVAQCFQRCDNRPQINKEENATEWNMHPPVSAIPQFSKALWLDNNTRAAKYLPRRVIRRTWAGGAV